MDRYPEINWNAVDFDYIHKLDNLKELNQIVDALEHEAAYPELLAAARKRLQSLQPNTARAEASPEDVKEALAELSAWGKKAKAADAALKQTANESVPRNLPPVRGTAAPAADKKKAGKGKTAELLITVANVEEAKRVCEAEKQKGNECFKAKEFHEALQYYSRAISAFDKDPAVFTNRAATYLKLKHYDKAEADCSAAIAIDPKFLKAWWRRGSARHYQLLYDSAIDDFKQALKLDPANDDVRKSLKESEAELKRTDPMHPYVTGQARPAGQSAPAKSAAGAAKSGKVGKALIEEVDGGSAAANEAKERKLKAEQDKAASAAKAKANGSKPAAGKGMTRVAIADADDDEDEADTKQSKPAQTAKPAAVPAKPADSKSSGGKTRIAIVDEDDEDEKSEATAAPAPPPAAQAAQPASSPTVASPAAAAAGSPSNDEVKLPLRLQSLVDQAEKHKATGNDLFGRSKYEEAIAAYTQALQAVEPTRADVAAQLKGNRALQLKLAGYRVAYLSNRANCYAQLNQPQSALADCSAALDLEGVDPDPSATAATGTAGASASKRFAAYPNKAVLEKLLLRRATSLESAEQWARALDDFESVLQLSPAPKQAKQAQEGVNRLRPNVVKQAQTAVEEAKTKGNKFFSDNKLEEAIAAYSRGITHSKYLRRPLSKENEKLVTNLRTNRALCFLKTNKWLDAKADCDAAISERADLSALADAEKVDMAKAFYRRGLAFKELKQWESAVDDFEVANRLQPADSTRTELYQAKSRLLTETGASLLSKDDLTADMGDPVAPVLKAPGTASKPAPAAAAAEAAQTPSKSAASDKSDKADSKKSSLIQEVSPAEAAKAATPSQADKTKPAASPKSETKSDKKATAAAAAAAAASDSSFPAPTNEAQFERACTALQNDHAAFAKYLKVMPPSKFGAIFKKSSSLTSEHIDAVVLAVNSVYKSDPAWSFAFLSGLAKLRRLKLDVAMVVPETTVALKAMFAFFASDGVAKHQLSKDAVEALREKYAMGTV